MGAGLTLSILLGAEFGRVVQLAFHAPSIAAQAAHWSSVGGAGPFFLFEHISLARSDYRGSPQPFDHSSAYGQLGDIMIELIHQHDDAPSAVRDMYAAHQTGLHHAAIFVDDLGAAAIEAERRNMAIALDAETSDGVRFIMADARAQHGCMLEFYEPSDALMRFYAFIRRKAERWDGREPLRRL